jgi:hypothetical protein
VRTLVVVLDDDYRVGTGEYLENIKTSLLMTRGVSRVEDGEVVTSADHVNRSIARSELLIDLIEFAKKWRR